MKKGKIIIISGPSGSGKTTLYKKLLDDKGLKRFLAKSVSFTTRPKREGEKYGRDYFFVSPKMFAYKRRAGHFLESENVFGNYYGTSRKNVRQILAQGKNVLLCIDVKGAKTVEKKVPAVKKIFIKTPSFEDLKCRLQARGSEPPQVVQKRLKSAQDELKEAGSYEHIIVNDNLTKAYSEIRTLLLTIIKE